MKLMPDVSAFVAKNTQKQVKRNANPKTSMHSLELVITVVVFVLIGRLLDSVINTVPVFTILFGSIGAVGSFLSAYYRYLYVSKKEDEGKVWSRETKQESVGITEEIENGLVIPQGYGAQDE